MVLVLALLGYAALTIVAAPLVLTRGHWRLRFPWIALMLWHGAFLSGILSALVSMIVAVALAIGVHGASTTTTSATLEPTVIILAAWLALGTVGGLVALVFARAEPLFELDREAEATFAEIIRSGHSRSERIGRLTVRFVDASLPVACTTPGRRKEVIVSSFLEDSLTPWELRAVIEHERAHVRHRHALAKRLALLNSACLPAVLGATEFKRATNLLIELIADDTAARVCGSHQVAAALARVAELSGSAGVAVRSERLLRLASQRAGTAEHRRLHSSDETAPA